MIDAIPTMAWCSLADGSVEFLNQRWHDYTGLPPEEAHGWGWKVAILHQDIASVMDNWQALLASGEAGYCRLAGGHDTVHPQVLHQLTVVIGDVPHRSGQGR